MRAGGLRSAGRRLKKDRAGSAGGGEHARPTYHQSSCPGVAGRGLRRRPHRAGARLPEPCRCAAAGGGLHQADCHRPEASQGLRQPLSGPQPARAVRQGPGRLRRGDQAHPEHRVALQQPRRDLRDAGRAGCRAQGLRQGGLAEPEVRRGAGQPRRCLRQEGRQGARRRRIPRRAGHRPRHRRGRERPHKRLPAYSPACSLTSAKISSPNLSIFAGPSPRICSRSHSVRGCRSATWSITRR